MSKSDYLENQMLDIVLGDGTFANPATVYVALHTADPTDAGNGAEVSGNNYARVAVTNNATNWPNASGGAKANGTAINFATPSGSWGTVTHFGIWDAVTTGNLLYYGALTVPQAITTGNAVSFAAGDIDITEA